MAFTFVEGGVCAAQGFSAGAVHAGIRKNHDKKDLALIFADRMCSAAAIYTQNKVKGAPLIVSRKVKQIFRSRASLPRARRGIS